MTLVKTRDLLDQAVQAHIGVAAFNVITLEHAEAIAAGAQAAAAPAILQVSQNAVKFHGGAVRPLAAALQEIARAAAVDLALHLDHVEDTRLLHQAADSGFSSVMFDASMLDYAANLAATTKPPGGHTNMIYFWRPNWDTSEERLDQPKVPTLQASEPIQQRRRSTWPKRESIRWQSRLVAHTQ